MAGLALGGLGLASVFPLALRTAAARAPAGESAVALAAVSTTGYLGFMAGPPLIGGLAAGRPAWRSAWSSFCAWSPPCSRESL